jgi:hypothetical protein
VISSHLAIEKYIKSKGGKRMKRLKKALLIILILIGVGITVLNFIPETIVADGFPNWTIDKPTLKCPDPYGRCYKLVK